MSNRYHETQHTPPASTNVSYKGIEQSASLVAVTDVEMPTLRLVQLPKAIENHSETLKISSLLASAEIKLPPLLPLQSVSTFIVAQENAPGEVISITPKADGKSLSLAVPQTAHSSEEILNAEYHKEANTAVFSGNAPANTLCRVVEFDAVDFQFRLLDEQPYFDKSDALAPGIQLVMFKLEEFEISELVWH